MDVSKLIMFQGSCTGPARPTRLLLHFDPAICCRQQSWDLESSPPAIGVRLTLPKTLMTAKRVSERRHGGVGSDRQVEQP